MVVGRLPFAALLVVCLGLSSEGSASLIAAPSLGGRNSAIGGNDVAVASDGPGILLSNAAGVVGQSSTRVNASLFTLFVNAHYTNPAIGYDTKSDEIPVAPTLWASTDRLAPWYVGAGVYGSVGASFNFPGSPAAGVPNRFFSELTILQLGIVVGRELLPGLRFAVQPAPTYGRIRAHFGTPLGPVSFDVDGFGIAGTAGLIYDCSSDLKLGVSYRSEGVVFLSGDGEVGASEDHVMIDFHTPQQVAFGFGYQLTPKLLLAAQARWTDYPQFEKGVFEFRSTAMLNQPFIGSARTTYRYGAGLELAATDEIWLRAGVSREPWMIEASSLSPLLSDYTDVLVGLGLAAAFGHWTADLVVGRPITEDRVVIAEKNPRFPGRYEIDGGVAGFSVTYRVD